VLRIAPRTHRVDRFADGLGFVHALVIAYGSVWVLGDELVRLDPVNETHVPVSGTASATTFNVAAGAGAVWVADDGRDAVDRIDPQSGRRVATVRVPGRAWGLAAYGDRVFVVSVATAGPVTGFSEPRLVRRIDPVRNRVSRSLLRLSCDPGIAVRARAVWIANPCAGTLARRDPRTLAATSRRRVPRWTTPYWGFGSVWLAGGASVIRVDDRTLETSARIPARASRAAIGESAVWLLDDYGGGSTMLRQLDPATNRVVAAIRLPRW
jgi:hypothetical protein